MNLTIEDSKNKSNFKRSNYNILIKEMDNGNVLIYNSLSGAFAIMNYEGKYVYNNIEKMSELKDQKYIDILEQMKSNGFIVNKSFDEFNYIQTIINLNKFSSNTLSLTIAPTLDCNMACPYCYENKQKLYMSKEVSDGIVFFIKKYIENVKIKYIHVIWYGGEPLLCKDMILDLSNSIIGLCENEKIEYSASIVTNGTLIDIETAKMLKNLKVRSAQITLDGLKEANNKTRLLKNGGDSFSIITKNIIDCKDIINIVVRCNIDKKNINQCDQLFDFFKTNSIDFYFAPVEKQTEVCNVKINQCYSYSEFSKIQFNMQKKLYNVSGNINNVEYPRFRGLACDSVATNQYVIDPKGNLYKCWDEVCDESKNVGTVKNGVNLNSNLVKWLNIELNSKCKKCNILPICLGGCPYKMLQGKDLQCHYSAVNFRKKLELYYEDYIKSKEKV